MVSNYYTENQIQTYADFNHDEKLIPFKTLCCDAMFTIQKNEQSKINVALEFERSDKSLTDYKKKLGNYYLESFIHVVFYVCHDKKTENKIKRADAELRSPDLSKIYFIQYSELIKEEKITSFIKQNNKFFPVT